MLLTILCFGERRNFSTHMHVSKKLKYNENVMIEVLRESCLCLCRVKSITCPFGYTDGVVKVSEVMDQENIFIVLENTLQQSDEQPIPHISLTNMLSVST